MRANPNSCDAHSTSSSPSRDRWSWTSAHAATSSSAKSRSPTASSEFRVGASKPSARAVCSRSIGQRRAGERAGAERRFVRAPRRIGDPAAIAREHRVVREQVVRESNGLRALQVRVAGNERVDVRAGLDDERPPQPIDGVDEALGRGDRVQPQIGRDLIVATAPGVEPAAGVADLVDEPRLDVHVDVLERLVPGQLAGREPSLDAAEPVHDRACVGLGDEPAGREHLGVRDRARDVVRE